MHTRRFAVSALLFAAAISLAVACGDSTDHETAAVAANPVVDCDKPASWPASTAEIRAGFADESFAIRECATNCIWARLDCAQSAWSVSGLVSSLDSLLSDPDLEVRNCAASSRALFPGNPAAGILLSQSVDVPSQVRIEALAWNMVSCSVSVTVSGQEPLFFANLQPPSPGRCGVGTQQQSINDFQTCPPGTSLHAEIICYGSHTRNAINTSDFTCPSPSPSPSPTP